MLSRAYKEKLKDFNFKCKKKIEAECITLMEHYLNSRIQHIKSLQSNDYMAKLFDNLKFYFNEEHILSRINIEFLTREWTINFDDAGGTQNVFIKFRALLFSLFKS